MIINSLNIPFLKRNSLLPPYPALLSEKYLTKGGGDISLAQSFCAKGDGATGYLNHGLVNVCGAGASSLVYECTIGAIPTATAYIISEYLTTGNARGWGVLYKISTNAFELYVGKSDGTYLGTLSVSGIGLVVGKKYKVEVRASGSNLVLEVFVDDVSQGTDTLVGQNRIYSNGADLLSFSYNNGSTFSDIGICNSKLTVDGVVKLNCPFQGSALDISGNDNHGTITGTVDLTERQDKSHRNIEEGFDLWFRTGGTVGTEADYIWVPHVNGVGVVSVITGYTLQSSHPAVVFDANDNPRYHNGSETAYDFPAVSLMDKSVVANWLVGIQATLGYDASNPERWYCDASAPDLQELAPTFIQEYWDDAKNKIFIASTPNEYLTAGTYQFDDVDGEMDTYDKDVVKSQSLLIYSVELTKNQVLKVMKYLKKIVGI